MSKNDLPQECNERCPIKKTTKIIEGKWTTLLIRELQSGKKRFSEMQKSLDGISPKILSARLRLLEKKLILTRTIYATTPPTTEYELTDLGKKLDKVLIAMALFGMELDKQPDVKVKPKQVLAPIRLLSYKTTNLHPNHMPYIKP